MNNLILLATICFVAMISPGPDFVLVTKNALTCAKPQALATAFGIVSGCVIHATYCILGLALVITKSIILFSLITYAGACYLIFIGIKGLTSKAAPHNSDVRPLVTRHISIKKAYLEGFLCNVLNPKLAVFLLSLFTQFIALDASATEKTCVAAIFVIESGLYWPTLVTILQSAKVRALFSRCQVWIDRTCGALLLCLGLKVAISRS